MRRKRAFKEAEEEVKEKLLLPSDSVAFLVLLVLLLLLFLTFFSVKLSKFPLFKLKTETNERIKKYIARNKKRWRKKEKKRQRRDRFKKERKRKLNREKTELERKKEPVN